MISEETVTETETKKETKEEKNRSRFVFSNRDAIVRQSGAMHSVVPWMQNAKQKFLSNCVRGKVRDATT